MSATRTPHRTSRPAAAAPLSVVVYRSRAVVPFAQPDLLSLTRAAQARNASESITGLVLFDDSRFFQWLEGPADSLDRVMRSINADGRHDDIQVLSHQRATRRTFADWNMKLGLRDAIALGHRGEVLDPSQEVLAALRRAPDSAPDALGRLAPRATGSKTTAGSLEALIRARVLPELLARHAAAPSGRRPAHPRVPDLAALLLGPTPEAATELLAALAAAPGASSLRRTLLEPTARHLGDLWADDACTEFDVTLALWRLETASRLVADPTFPRGARPHRAPARTVLVVPHPGEPHRIGAAFSASSLTHAGWDVTPEHPADDDALGTLLAAHRYDALDIALSPALPRADRLRALSRTVAVARRASRHTALTITVGGRIFAEGRAVPQDVGADLPSHALPLL